VERALTLIATGALTIAVAQASKKGKTPHTFNFVTSKGSMRRIGFNDVAWGKATRSYATMARALPKVKFDGIIQGAQLHNNLKSNHVLEETTEAVEAIKVDDNDERGCLVASDISDDDDIRGCLVASDFSEDDHERERARLVSDDSDDCKSIYLSATSPT